MQSLSLGDSLAPHTPPSGSALTELTLAGSTTDVQITALEAAVQAFSSSHGAVPLAPSARQAPPHALLQLQAAAVPLAPHALQPTFADVLAGL